MSLVDDHDSQMAEQDEQDMDGTRGRSWVGTDMHASPTGSARRWGTYQANENAETGPILKAGSHWDFGL